MRCQKSMALNNEYIVSNSSLALQVRMQQKYEKCFKLKLNLWEKLKLIILKHFKPVHSLPFRSNQVGQ